MKEFNYKTDCGDLHIFNRCGVELVIYNGFGGGSFKILVMTYNELKAYERRFGYVEDNHCLRLDDVSGWMIAQNGDEVLDVSEALDLGGYEWASIYRKMNINGDFIILVEEKRRNAYSIYEWNI